jgi:hypothetical protein
VSGSTSCAACATPTELTLPNGTSLITLRVSLPTCQGEEVQRKFTEERAMKRKEGQRFASEKAEKREDNVFFNKRPKVAPGPIGVNGSAAGGAVASGGRAARGTGPGTSGPRGGASNTSRRSSCDFEV